MNHDRGSALTLASRWHRLAATVIDAILVPALTLVLIMLTNVLEDAEDYADSWWILHVLALAILSYLLLNGIGLKRRGQTIGKKLMQIMVVPAQALDHPGNHIEPASLWKLICIRAWFFAFLFVMVVPWIFLLPLIDHLLIFSSKRRCLHDILAGTIVIKTPDDN